MLLEPLIKIGDDIADSSTDLYVCWPWRALSKNSLNARLAKIGDRHPDIDGRLFFCEYIGFHA